MDNVAAISVSRRWGVGRTQGMFVNEGDHVLLGLRDGRDLARLEIFLHIHILSIR